MSETQRAFDRKTKPRSSLGMLEDMAVRIGALRDEAVPTRPECAIVVVAGLIGIVAYTASDAKAATEKAGRA